MPVAHGQAGVRQELHKFKAGQLHSGSSHGPLVRSRKQAVAIALHEAGMSRKDNPGSLANRGGSAPHAGVDMKKKGQSRSKPAPAAAKSSMYGGPPAEGFHRLGAEPAARSEQRPIAKKPELKHLGRFATGKPRTVTSRSTSVSAAYNC